MAEPSDNPNAKVFFALWPSAAERDRLAAWQKPLQRLCGGRAMRSDSLHNTLVFIGNVGLARLEALQRAAQEVGVQGFELCFDAAHYWKHNHIVYAAPGHPPTQLAQLVDALEQHLSAQGFSFDQREYQPHVTLFRNARWSDVPRPEMLPVCWQARDFALVQSVSRDGLADYRVLAKFPLG
ncbi:MAG: RNA 2',3'-cyclic phosphodiesterase [Gallionella sp.]